MGKFYAFKNLKNQISFNFLSLLFLVVLGSVIATQSVQAQAPTVTYQTAKNLIKAYGQDTLKVRIVFNGSCTGTQVRVGMPVGVTYVGGTVSYTSPSSLTMTESDISNLRRPLFNVNGYSYWKRDYFCHCSESRL